MKINHNKLRNYFFRLVSVILCLSILVTVMDFSVFSLNNERKNSLHEWFLEVTWDNDDKYNYSVTSGENETIRPKMKIKYYASQAETDYQPGDVRITVSGLDDIERNNTIIGSTTTENSDSKWVLLESTNYNEYVFANKYEIHKNDSLSGGFEIMWEYKSRDAYNGYSTTISPEFSIKNSLGNTESITLPDLTYAYHSERDYYYLNIESQNIQADEYEAVMGIDNSGAPSVYENYVWHREVIKFYPQERARGTDFADFFVAVKVLDSDDPATGNEVAVSSYSGVQVLRNDGTRTNLQAYNLYDITHRESDRSKTVYGYYEFTDHIGELSNDDYILYLGFPYQDTSGNYISTFDSKYIYVDGYLNAQYKDESDYIRLNSVLLQNENIFASTVKINEYYGFRYSGGVYSHYQYNNDYEVVDMNNKAGEHRPPATALRLVASEVYKKKVVYFNLEMNARRVYSTGSSSSSETIRTTSSGAAPGDVILPRDEGVFLEQGIDRISVELEDGSIRRLLKDEYDITSVTVPMDEYERSYKLYVSETPDLDYDLYDLFGQGNTRTEKTFNLPSGKYCAFYVKMEDVNGTYFQVSNAGISFHLRENMTPKIDPNGKIISFSFFRVMYTDPNDGQEKKLQNITRDDYIGDYSLTIADDDMRTQGEYLYRRYSNVFLRLPVLNLISATQTTEIEREEGEEYIKQIDDLYGGGYAFLVSSYGSVVADIVGDLKKFSVHTLLPEELVPADGLSGIQYSSTGILEGIKVSGLVNGMDGNQISGDDLENYVRYEVEKRPDTIVRPDQPHGIRQVHLSLPAAVEAQAAPEAADMP